MNNNSEIKKLMLVVLVDIEMLLKNDNYKDRKDELKKIKSSMEKLAFKETSDNSLLEKVKDSIVELSLECNDNITDSDYEVLYNDFEKLYKLVVNN